MTLTERIDRLVDTWCGERHVEALRILLPCWPVAPLTDEWARVHEALKAVHEQAAADFASGERMELEDVIQEVGRVVYRR